MELLIAHRPETCRFETLVDGFTAYVEYRREDNVLDVIHTIVPPALEGRGIASRFVGAAYDYAREEGLTFKATCSYAIAWLQRKRNSGQ